MLWTCHVLVHSCSHIGPGSSSLVRGHFASSFPPWFRSFPPPSPMLHRWVVVEVVPWEFPTSCIPTSLQTPVCWDCICQLMGRPVWDWGHPEDSGPAGSFSLMYSVGLDFFCTTLKMMRCDCGNSRVLDVTFSYLQVCEKLKQRKPCCERVMYLYIVVHILGPEVHVWSVAILLQVSHLGFVLSHHHPLCSTVEWLWRWFLGNSPPRVYRLLYRPRFVGIVSVNWWGVLLEIEVTLKTVDPLVLFLWCTALDLIFLHHA